MVSQSQSDGLCLKQVIVMGAGAVGIDIVNILRLAMPASFMAFSMARAAPLPSSAGEVMWNASQVAPYPTTSARILAPRAFACSRDSSTTPGALAHNKTIAVLVKGMDALEASSVVFRAVRR